MDEEQRPAWPGPNQTRVERLLNQPLALVLGVTAEAFRELVWTSAPFAVSALVIWSSAIIIRARQMDMRDRNAEEPVITLRPYSGLAGHHHPHYRPSGSLLRNLPVESDGSFYHVDYHVINEGKRGALLEAEGRAEGEGGMVVLSHALWSVLSNSTTEPPPVEKGVEFLPVPAGAHLRVRLSVYIGPKAAEQTKTAAQLADLRQREEAGQPWYVHVYSMQQLQFWVWDRLRRPRAPIKVEVLADAFANVQPKSKDIVV